VYGEYEPLINVLALTSKLLCRVESSAGQSRLRVLMMSVTGL